LIDYRQTGLNEGSHQGIDNLHTGMKAPQPFGRPQGMGNFHTGLKDGRPQGVGNLHTGMKGPQSFGRQPPQSFRAPQPFQSAIPTTSRDLIPVSREEISFEPIRPLVNPLIRPHEPRRHSGGDLPRFEIRPPQPSLMDQIDEIPTGQNPLEITDIFGRLNIADKIEKAKEIAKEKGKAKEQH
jgi:hypothetical protein